MKRARISRDYAGTDVPAFLFLAIALEDVAGIASRSVWISVINVSAAEIIALIKKLPPADQAEVVAFARALSDRDVAVEVRYMPDDKFAEVAPQVFAKHRELMRKLAQ